MTPEPRLPQQWTLQSIMNWTIAFLKEKGWENARLDTELLLCKVLNLKRIDLYVQYDRPLNSEEQQQFGALLRRRLKGEPVAYLLGYREFWGQTFKVTPQVLIPRPDTEILVEEALGYLKSLQALQAERPLRLLDVGTGSGCLAISLALACPQLEAVAWDISPAALAVAQENAQNLGVADRLRFEQVDALQAETWSKVSGFDVLVSNPPYISPAEKASLDPGVKDFEPELALFAEHDGLAFYQAMARWAKPCLNSQARIFWELGYTQKAAVSRILEDEGWKHIQVTKDYASLDRVISADLM